jgi:5-amino-6-(5-phosphoribosylamino)uracil reductase
VRPYVLLSAAVSVDGFLDDTAAERLVLSGPEDLDRVDAVRAGVDAILVGATTVRRDDPRLRVRSAERVAARVAAGLPPQPLRVVLTGSGALDPGAQVFAPDPVGPTAPDEPAGAITGGAAAVGRPRSPVVVYAASAGVGRAREALVGLSAAATDTAGPADVVDAGDPLDPARLLADLHARGVRRLMVEGGGAVHTLFLTAGLADELHLAVAPFFVGEADAPRFVRPGAFPHGPGHRMALDGVERVGDVVVLRYLLAGAGG